MLWYRSERRSLPYARDRFFVVTPWLWPSDDFAPFDRAILTTTISQFDKYRVRCWRWERGRALELWPGIQPLCERMVGTLSGRDVQVEWVIGPERVSAHWPRWNQVGGVGLRRDAQEIHAAITVALAEFAQSSHEAAVAHAASRNLS